MYWLLGQCIAREWFEHQMVLQVRHQYYGVLAEVQCKCLAAPAAHALHTFQQNTSQKIL